MGSVTAPGCSGDGWLDVDAAKFPFSTPRCGCEISSPNRKKKLSWDPTKHDNLADRTVAKVQSSVK